MRLGVFAVAAALLACSAERQPSGTRDLVTPLAADASTVEQSARVEAGAAATLSLEQFTPLLADPSLAAAARSLERGAVGVAARQVAAAMVKHPPSAAELPRWQFLLARLQEEAGQVRAAAGSYELAAGARWPLSGYAWLGAGRTLVRAGELDAGLVRLGRVPLHLPVAEEARLLMAEVSFRNRDLAHSIRLWRDHLQSATRPRDWVTVSLRLSEALLDQAEAEPAASSPPETEPAAFLVVEALHLARQVELQQVTAAGVRARASALERRALLALPAAVRAQLQQLTPEDQLVKLRALLEARIFAQAREVADLVLRPLRYERRWDDTSCETGILRAKALAGDRAWGRAADSLADVVRRCHQPDQQARALYLAGKYAAADGRHMQAVTLYQQLERDHPRHRLADDARLQAALCYHALGVPARFTELLSRMPEDYPEGDMVLDGVFGLALRRIEKGDWSGAAAVLDRGAALVEGRDSARGTEFSGRERYFRARAWIETGERQRGLDEYAAIISELPLSYYMLHAYARLVEADPFRAQRVRESALQRSIDEPFSFEYRPEFDEPGFMRAMELLRLGEVELGRRELEALSMVQRGAAPEILWGVALLYARAGSARLSHAITRGLLTDWLARWPAGDWVQAWQLAFPRPYRAIVRRQAARNQLPESLVYAVMREESAFDPDAVSPAEAHGLMQLIVPTARLFARRTGLPHDAASLKRPHVNIAFGCRVLADLLKTFSKNPVLAIPGYNAGPGRPRAWLHDRPHLDFDVWVELIPLRETLRYTKRVLASRAAYAYLYERETADPVMALPIRLVP